MSVLVLLGTQWGDEGKGKIIDVLSERVDVVVRYHGGPNAGHTVVVGDTKTVTHLIPSGILRPNCRCIIAGGMVVDPGTLIQEMEDLEKIGVQVTPDNLLISGSAHVILPYHKALDGLEEKLRGSGKIGTTMRGIGPCYADKVGKNGIRMYGLIDPEVFPQRLHENLEVKNALIVKVYGGEPINERETLERYLGYAKRMSPYVGDASLEINLALNAGKKILFEGAQGSMLDVDHGTYPYVTSSNTTAGSVCTGAGIGPRKIDRVLGIAKAYTTRVGSGPFPTELSGDIADKIRNAGPIGEYGATTGRPRRCGWFDSVVVRRGIMLSGIDSLAVMRLDVLSEFDTIRICTAYEKGGETLEHMPATSEGIEECRPIYEELPGWGSDISGVTRFEDLPKEAQGYVERLEELLGIPVAIVSIGPKRSQTILREQLI